DFDEPDRAGSRRAETGAGGTSRRALRSGGGAARGSGGSPTAVHPRPLRPHRRRSAGKTGRRVPRGLAAWTRDDSRPGGRVRPDPSAVRCVTYLRVAALRPFLEETLATNSRANLRRRVQCRRITRSSISP